MNFAFFLAVFILTTTVIRDIKCVNMCDSVKCNNNCKKEDKNSYGFCNDNGQEPMKSIKCICALKNLYKLRLESKHKYDR
ncbi:hypothetical protein TSAR_005451 [Trichomalopsis sarcophagae]|uniref:Uncharacterized protein n=1 Tax=Trichomalopsis sarcophagae TaxID=543379 RepID=A0A232EP21_9HYME|nr:hypothetical protein TSAR_005451 [Trichomalopsis sarcophagae]